MKDVVEFTRIVEPQNHDDDALQAQVSPNGRQAFLVTRRSDVATDKNVFEILLLDVAPERLAALQRERQDGFPQRLFAIEAHEDSDDADPSLQDARWLSDRTIVFRARVDDQPFQAYALDVGSRKLTQLTFEPRGLLSFDVTADLTRIVYVAPVPNPPLLPGASSVVVGTQSFWTVKFGQNDLHAQQRRYQYWVTDGGSRRPARRLGNSFPEGSRHYPRVSISPDGRWALMPVHEPARQLDFARLYPPIADVIARFAPSLAQDPLHYYSGPPSYVARRLVAYRLADGHAQTVLDAPDDSGPGTGQMRPDRLWQGDGASVVIAGTYVPVDGGDAAAPRTSRLVEYWPDAGRWRVIAALKGRLLGVYPVPGRSDAFVALDGSAHRIFVRTADGSWSETDGVSANVAAKGGTVGEGWTLRVVEALNQPPDVVASGPGGGIVRLTALNPQYSASTWGTIQPYSWKDSTGRTWDGGLMTPSRFDASTRHPLVIQTYGFSPSRFYLDGSNLYDGYTSGFAGRAFLREGILVLAFPWGPSDHEPADEHGAILAFMQGVRGAIDKLVSAGLVDRDRIGIMGWSATGERVLNQLTFSDTPIRAATILDGDANTLFSMAITYAALDGIQARKESVNEGAPFGASLPRWIRNDPSLHTDCVKAALRIETYGPLVLNNWDIYALLRRQYKPVEMIVIPGGAHALARPAERMVSLQGNVDWYRFWLEDEQRSEPVLAGETDEALKRQYARWRQMEQLKRTDDAKPRCLREFSDG